ncbi:MAG: pimeloyl-ACP methyl ester carboxylesterase [Saprospiraceae bacterium]|jgi:pimeloyl-ACP methyl ester carboxylesterase
MKIYCIPGLGYDHRIFEHLNLRHFNTTAIDWTEPIPRESFKRYTERFSKKIDDSSGKVVLIGHSLGGMISQEISRIKRIDKIILVSSIRSREEIPLLFKMVAFFNLDRFFTKEWVIKTLPLWGKQHDFVTREEQNLFKDMVAKQSNEYLQWALRQLSDWQTPTIPESTKVFQIHGDADKSFPIKRIKKPDRIIKHGSHIMVYKQPELISEIILEVLEHV